MNEPRARPLRGEVWLVDLGAARGHEQEGIRPAVIISTDLFNRGRADLLVIAPMTTTGRSIPWQVSVSPPEGGLARPSLIKSEDVRSISTERLLKRMGNLAADTMAEIADRLRILLEL